LTGEILNLLDDKNRTDRSLSENILILLVLILPTFGTTLVGIKSHREFFSISLNRRRMIDGINNFKDELKQNENYEDLFKTIKKIEWFFANKLKRWETIIRSRELEWAL